MNAFIFEEQLAQLKFLKAKTKTIISENLRAIIFVTESTKMEKKNYSLFIYYVITRF